MGKTTSQETSSFYLTFLKVFTFLMKAFLAIVAVSIVLKGLGVL